MMMKSWTCRRRTGHLLLWYYIFVWCTVSLCDVASFDRFTGRDRCCLGPSGYRNSWLSISSQDCEHIQTTDLSKSSALKHTGKLEKTRPSFQARLASSWWWTQKSLWNTRACHGCEDCALFVLFLHVSSSCMLMHVAASSCSYVPAFTMPLRLVFKSSLEPGTQSWRLDRVHEFTHWLMLKFCSSGKDTWFGVEPLEHKRHWQDIVTYCI